MKPLSSCLLVNLQHCDLELIAFLRLLLLHNPRKNARSRPPRSIGAVEAGRPLATSEARYCLHCFKSEATESQINIRFEFNASFDHLGKK